MSEAQNHGRLDATLPAWTLHEFHGAADALVDEYVLNINEDGFSATATDPANVGMFDIHLSAEAFDSYEADEDRIGIYADPITELLETVDVDTPIRFETAEFEKYHLTFDGFEYTRPWISPDSLRKVPDLPDMGLPATVEIPGDTFFRQVRRCDEVATHVVLKVDPDEREFIMDAEGEKADGVFTTTEGVVKAGEAWSHYSMDYLYDMAAAVPPDTTVTLHIGEEFPLSMEYDIADGAGHVEFMLAPRIGGAD